MTESESSIPEFLDSKKVFSGRVFDVTIDTVREGDKTYTREVVHHSGSAVILPVFEDGTVALVKQYRHPAVKYLLELPAGTLNDRERPEDGAARELEEETGYRLQEVRKVFEAFTSPGAVTEKLHFFVAEYDPSMRIGDGGGLVDEGEDIEVLELPIDQALAMIADGRIVDAKTIMLLQYAALHVFR